MSRSAAPVVLGCELVALARDLEGVLVRHADALERMPWRARLLRRVLASFPDWARGST